jgi:hypothetical protein
MLAIAKPRARDPKPTVSIVPEGTDLFFCFISQHFVLGYFRRVPAGLIFSNRQRTCTIQIASSLR